MAQGPTTFRHLASCPSMPRSLLRGSLLGFLHGPKKRTKTERTKLNLRLHRTPTSAQGGLQCGGSLAFGGGYAQRVPFPRGGVANPVCPLGVFAALGKSQNERGPFRGPASWPNPYSVRRYNELLSYGHNILAECSGSVMRMCGFRGYSRTCSLPSWIDRGRTLRGLSAQNAIVRFTLTSVPASGIGSLPSG